MSGTVEILNDRAEEFVVVCFNTDCPQHMHSEPWVDEFDTITAARRCAREHRQMIRDYWKPDRCGECGQRVKAADS